MTLKILYALSDNSESVEICRRFLEATSEKNYIIKIAAYYNHSMPFFVDWNLEACDKFYGRRSLSFDNENLRIYFNQVKNFNPDLIICDLEKYTTYIASVFDFKIWQVSSIFQHRALKNKLPIRKYYTDSFNRIFSLENRSITNAIIRSNDTNFAYTYLGDYSGDINLDPSYNLIRPYFYLGQKSTPCKHNSVLTTENIKAINFAKNYSDAVVFSKFNEDYNNLIVKNYYNSSDYSCNVYNANYTIGDGDINFLADSFYNRKFSFLFPNFNNLNNIINSFSAQYFNLGKVLFKSNKINIENIIKNFNLKINDRYCFLHEKIDKEFNI